MDINDYLKRKDKDNNFSPLKQGPFYDETVKDFYKNCIEKELCLVRRSIEDWDKMLNDYIKLDVPVFWIRKYESVGDKDSSGKQNNRRGGLTLVVDSNEKIKFAYAFISNYDAQEFYNMVRSGVPAPAASDFNNMMWQGSFQLHYDPNGGDCQDDKIAYFENRGNVRSGILNQQNWYLAHIIDVNNIEYINSFSLSNSDIDRIFFPRGTVTDWIPVKKCSPKIHPLLNKGKIISNGLDRKVRIIKVDTIYQEFRKTSQVTVKDSVIDDFFKELLIARFMRFLHPLNYFLVPSIKCEINGIFGRKNVSIGEYRPLILYVENEMGSTHDFLKIKEGLNKKIMNKGTRCGNITLGKTKIHINYGTKYCNYIFLDDGITVKVPTGYTDIEDFLKNYNISRRLKSLEIKYTITGETNELLYSPHSDVSQEKIKNKIKTDMRKRRIFNEINELDSIEIGVTKKSSATKKSSGSAAAFVPGTKKTRSDKKYMFHGERFNGRDVVLTVVNSYLKDNPMCTLSKLLSDFGGVPSIVKKSSEISDKEKGIGTDFKGKKNTRRYFVNEEITLADGNKIMVSNQWTGNGGSNDNMHLFIDNAEKLGYTVTIM